jgi:hypothetical protein
MPWLAALGLRRYAARVDPIFYGDVEIAANKALAIT